MPSCAVVSHLLWAHWAGYWADTHHHLNWADTYTTITGQTHTHLNWAGCWQTHTPTLKVRRKEWEICFLFGEEDGYQGEVESVDKCWDLFSLYLPTWWEVKCRLVNVKFSIFFTGPRCLWGPVYGSRCLYLSISGSFGWLCWCNSGWWWYQLNTIDDANIKQSLAICNQYHVCKSH